ncbi:right-handed parallel beta-helix repeat-containing protein [Jiangella muralis]|uniref:right-handed parallel beta-helix repeat-containing protein n=1 Tax=Jiangella muralis TaxID=702383 RepID=UPI00069E847C|nr:right-handed parallel beta-helix repeat-containing protein [Jiangella muralis]
MADPHRLRRRTVLAGAAAAAVATQLPRAAATAAYPTFDIRADFGAAGNGSTNDTTAFQQAAAAIQAAGGGTLTIPAGVYVVGRQTHTSGVTPYYVMEPIFALTGVQFLHVKGAAGAVLRLAAGLRFGSFHPTTGARYDPPSLPFTTASYGVEAGRMIEVLDGSDLTIENLELDGNNDQLVLGGEFGDTGRQLKATGIRLLGCTNVRITDVHAHHHGLDGVTVGQPGHTAADPATPHTITRLRSEYNGRQGLSWTGGRGLTCTDSQFNHTGRAAVQSAPSAGVDIEAEGSVCRDGLFTGCEFVNNAGSGLDVTHGDSGYTRFEGCTFWGTTTYSAYTTKPGLVFKWSTFNGTANVGYGSADAALATVYADCHFEDRPWTNGQVYRGTYLVTDAGNTGQNVRYADCTFVARELRSIWTNDITVQKHFVRCTIDHRYAALADGGIQCHPWGARLVACTFTESMGTSARNWYIHLNDILVENDVDGTQTTVTGPRVHWGSASGPVGTIAEGTYG